MIGNMIEARPLKSGRFSRSGLLTLAVVPVGMFVALFPGTDLVGPFFLVTNLDPAYHYLMNAMTMLCGHTPRHIDHPGTPLQLLGAGVIGAMNLLRGASPICPEDVFVRPEIYLSGINAVLRFLTMTMLFCLPARLYVLSGSLIAAFAVQASFLVSTTIVTQLERVHPEVLLMPLIMLLGLLLLPIGLGLRPERPRDPILAGAVMGVAVATKITVLPLMLFAFMFESTKAKLRFLLMCFAAFILSTLPILSMNKRFVTWIVNMASRSGHYGEGAVGLPAVSTMLDSALKLLAWNKTEFVCAGFILVFSVWLWRRRGKLDPNIRFMLISVGVLLAQWAITIKHPGARYMMPALLALVVANGVVAATLDRLRHGYAAIYLGAILLIGGVGAWQNFQHFHSVLPARHEADRRDYTRIRDIASRVCGKLVFHETNSDVQFALRAGDVFTEARFRFRLAQLYPGFVYYHHADETFYSFSTLLGTDVPAGNNDKPTCTLGTVKLPEGGQRGLRKLAEQGDFHLYAFGR